MQIMVEIMDLDLLLYYRRLIVKLDCLFIVYHMLYISLTRNMYFRLLIHISGSLY